MLSVGYVACHWCHVMARVGSENEGTAALTNNLFISIGVGRKEEAGEVFPRNAAGVCFASGASGVGLLKIRAAASCQNIHGLGAAACAVP